MSKKKRLSLKDDIFEIRDVIQVFEDVKDRVIDYLEKQPTLENNTREMWISDIKECYYNLVGAWQMLSSAATGKTQYIDSSTGFLQAATSRCAQSVSELRSFNDKEAGELIALVEAAFDNCRQAIATQIEDLQKMQPGPGTDQPRSLEKVIKVSSSEYHLPCSECGAIAAEFKIGIARFDKEESLIFNGITHSCSLKKELSGQLFSILDKGNITLAHKFMKKHWKIEGIDAYCPRCKKIYCKTHYHTRETYDDGFYDCTYGTCPAGHERIIHD